MKILSVNVGLPREIVSSGHSVITGIFKTPVHGRVKVNKLNMEGDTQADLSVHGGPNKAVYAYPSEHYAYWQRELPDAKLQWGAFGENLTQEGLLEDEACIGDRFRVGTAILMATQPRLPCYKLGIKFGRDDMPERFLASGRTGFYFAVVEEGELGQGDLIEPVERDPSRISVSKIFHLYFADAHPDVRQIERVLQLEALTPGWRKRFLEKLRHSKG